MYTMRMKEMLKITILKNPQFFTLYADGNEETILKTNTSSVLLYPPDAVIFLYYTFSTHRRVYCVRNVINKNAIILPGLSQEVTILFKQFASRVDKTKKVVSFLREHYSENVFVFDDGFYVRLDVLLKMKGTLDYYALDLLSQRSKKNGCIVNA